MNKRSTCQNLDWRNDMDPMTSYQLMQEKNNIKTADTNTRLHEVSLSQELVISSHSAGSLDLFNGVLMTGLESNLFP